MIRILLLFLLLLTNSSLLPAQSVEQCATIQALHIQQEQSPELIRQMEQAEAKAEAWLRDHPDYEPRSIITIPVVVHILWVHQLQYLSMAQIQSQLDVINADFGRLNTDTSMTRAVFKGRAADFEIEFCLANIDPDGNPTNGVTRKRAYPSNGYFFEDVGQEDVKRARYGGADPWPSDQYLNIWVAPLGPYLYGYAQFPGMRPDRDGIVISTDKFGTIGWVDPDVPGGRTTTHEIGHWLGLQHIWGNEGCNEDDRVEDTPTAFGPYPYPCPFNVNSCTDSLNDEVDMGENYMDYTTGSCQNAFTEGQKMRAYSFLMTDRLSILSSPGCARTVQRQDEDQHTLNNLRIFPNPARNLFEISLEDNPSRAASYRLTDLRGMTLLVGRFSPQTGPCAVRTDHLAAGIYLLKVDAGGQSKTLRLVLE